VYLDTAPADAHEGPALLAARGFEVDAAVAADTAAVIRAGTGATALLIGDSPVHAEAIAALPDLRIVSTVTVGVDHIDVEAAHAAGIAVAHVPDAVTEEVAVSALALILGLVRHTHALDRSVRAGAWDPFATGPRRRPSTLTLGVVGAGRIGRRVAELAAPVFGRVLACDPIAEIAPPAEAADLERLLRESDVVSLHAPGRAGAPPLIGAAELALLPPGAHLVNVARGSLVDTAAVLAALDDGRLGGVALDVLDVEPPAPDAPILQHPRAIVNPHAAFWSVDAEAAAYAHQARNVLAWLDTGAPLTPVRAPDRQGHP
jgi:phosphoglycerate dehydrogenase-like enzyme